MADQRPPMVTCPAGICEQQAAVFDHDGMFGHLLVAHSWTFETAESWVIEHMPDDAADIEARFIEEADSE